MKQAKVTIYVPSTLNVCVDNRKIVMPIDNRAIVNGLEECFAREFFGFSELSPVYGGWIDSETGLLVREAIIPVMVIVEDTPDNRARLEALALGLKLGLNQDSVLLTFEPVRALFVA
jgi:hypothetical protein